MDNKLNRLIKQGESFKSVSSGSPSSTPEFKTWKSEVSRYLTKTYGKDSFEFNAFKEVSFYNIYLCTRDGFQSDPSKAIPYFQKGLKNALLLLNNYLEDIDEDDQQISTSTINNTDSKQVFIVHGHDEAAKNKVARFVERLGFEATILHEQASKGKTIIEKIEHYSDVCFGIVLYTPDDVGNTQKEKDKLNLRARQNVVFEHGYLIGKLGRKSVVALVDGNIEKPNDISGVVYIPLDKADAWHFAVAKEMKACGCNIDMNNLV